MSRRRQLLLAAGVSGLLALLSTVSLGPLEVFELKALDLRFRLRERLARHDPAPQVRALVVDDPTLEAPGGSLPELYAEALERLRDGGARTVGLRTSFYPPSQVPSGEERASDARLLAAVAGAPGMVVGVPLPHQHPIGADLRIAPVPETKSYPWPRAWTPDYAPATVLDPLDLAFPGLAAAAHRLGHQALEVDPDGVLRNVELLHEDVRGRYPSLVLQVACEYFGVSPRDVVVVPGKCVELRKEGRLLRRIPIDERGRLLVNYRTRRAARSLPVGEFLSGGALDLKGRAILLGTTAGPIGDAYPTALEPLVSDVDIQAEALETILADSFVRRVGGPLQLVITASFLLLGALLMVRSTPWRAVGIGLGVMALYQVFEKAAFVWGGLWLDFFRPMTALQAAVVVFPLYNYRNRNRELLDELGLLRRFDDMILMSMTSGVVVAGRDGRVVKHNARAAWLLGREDDDLVGVPLRDLLAGSRQATDFLDRSLVKPSAGAPEPSNPATAEAAVVFPSGKPEGDSILHLEVSLVDPELLLRHEHEHEHSPCWVITFSDVTEQVRLAQEDERRARLAAMGEIAAKLGHEIRNSLGGLRLYVENVREETRPQSPGRRAIDMMVEEIESLYRKIEELREFARDPVLDVSDCDLKQLLDEALAYSGQKLQEKRIQVTLECEPRMPPLQADRRQIREAFQNLINNAVEAAPVGGHLRISAERVRSSNGAGQTGNYAVQFEDDGPGIAPEIGDQVFSLFFTTKPDIGTGLGLPIVKKIVETHGGRISFRSDPGRGACFTVTLPPARRGES